MDSSDYYSKYSFQVEPNDKITFYAKEIAISTEHLCMKFDEPFLTDFEKINILEFEIGDKKFRYKKEKDE